VIIFTYLLSRDLVETLERKFGLLLDSSLKRDIRRLEEEFIDNFWKYIPSNVKPVCLSAQEVSNQMETELIGTQLPVISLDRVYVPNAQDFLEVTRQTDQQTGEVRIAERPGYPAIEEQIKRIRQYNPVLLADVGAFEGTTLLEICGLLERNGMNIEQVILGISSKEANKKLNKTRKVTALNLFNFYEWIELRDLLGIDGRNVGIKDERREFMPYWENLCKWASMPEENREEVERLCKEFNIQLIGRLWQEGYDLSKIGRPVKYLGKK